MKKKIVIASVLKPVDDVRAYWKLSQSIAKTNKYEVNIIGNKGKKPSSDENIRFHPISIKRSNWLKRVLIREQILFKVLRLKPDILIITTHELINTALLCKILLRCKVVYDVQENYKKNLIHINPAFMKKLAAWLVRWKENLSQLFIDTFWLAEKCYVDELSFTSKKNFIIENKAFKYSMSERDYSIIKMLYSGTVSDYGGVKRAVDLFIHLIKKNQNCKLHIIGQVHDKSLSSWLKNQQKMIPQLELNISDRPIPHEEILNAIDQCNLGIIGYMPSEVNKHKVPTKLYEYSRYRLPYLVQKNTQWCRLGKKLGGAIPIDFKNISGDDILKSIANTEDLFPNQYPEEATWEYESQKILQSLNSLINES